MRGAAGRIGRIAACHHPEPRAAAIRVRAGLLTSAKVGGGLGLVMIALEVSLR
jgi:hypothetical protein